MDEIYKQIARVIEANALYLVSSYAEAYCVAKHKFPDDKVYERLDYSDVSHDAHSPRNSVNLAHCR